MRSRIRLPAFTIVTTLVLIGCRHRAKKHVPPPPPSSAPVPVVQTTEVPLTPPKAPRLPVKQGPAPLAYMIQGAGVVQVIEMESGAVLGQANAEPGEIVSVDEIAGARVGKTLLSKGPLPAGRTYQIFLEAGGENVSRSIRISPGR